MNKYYCFFLFLFASFQTNAQTITGKSNRIHVKVNSAATGDKPALAYGNVTFRDGNNNQAIDPAEETEINFTIKNLGKAASKDLFIKAYSSVAIKGLSFGKEIRVTPLKPGDSTAITIPIRSARNLESGTANVIIEIKPEYEYDADQIEINILTEEARK